MRHRRNDFALIGMTVVMAALFFALYFDASNGKHTSSISEYLFRAFTHMQADILLTISNVLLWGTVPDCPCTPQVEPWCVVCVDYLLRSGHHGHRQARTNIMPRVPDIGIIPPSRGSIIFACSEIDS